MKACFRRWAVHGDREHDRAGFVASVVRPQHIEEQRPVPGGKAVAANVVAFVFDVAGLNNGRLACG